MAPGGDTRYVDRRMDQPGQGPDTGAPSHQGPRPDMTGVAELSGRPDGPALPPPAGLAGQVRRMTGDVERHSARLGRRVVVDPVSLLVGRAGLSRFRRRGPFNCGGSARVMRSADGWMVANLARPDDWDLLDAWLQPSSPLRPGRWEGVVAGVARQPTATLVERAALLGLPAAAVGERPAAGPGAAPGASDLPPSSAVHGVGARCLHPGRPADALTDLLVVDLSALWAGPLASQLLRAAGCRVLKVESVGRPDAARHGPPGFFSMVNGGKESVALDVATAPGRRRLAALVARADVVVTAARPRALEQLGLRGDEWAARAGSRVWLAITGYGREGDSAGRVAFGDDAAAAGGLVVWEDRGPSFCGDAIADPLSGVAGAAAVLAALGEGGGWMVDVAMADVSAGCVGGPPADPQPGPGTGTSTGGDHRPAGQVPESEWWPRSSPSDVAALGADTEAVLADLGIG